MYLLQKCKILFMSEDIGAFVNRLGKNIKHLRKWAQRQDIEAWRMYDRDIPQYPFAADIYADHVHLQEYDTGWLMHKTDYEKWLAEVVEAVLFVTGLPKEHIHVKKRQRQKGKDQYEKTGITGTDFVIHEHGRAFWVNLDKYLDTGLFLDHRNTRQKIGNIAAGKRFLNLFAYTGSFSVYAATGGALFSETVDLSNTYLQWAQRNFELNGLDMQAHQIVRADVFQYLQKAVEDHKQFDLIVMDPPSFSNSKKMLDILDIQRDQEKLIDGAMRLLSKQGSLYFSNNLRSFELNPVLEQRYDVSNISKKTIPEDFRNTRIHQCWEIRKG